MRIMGIDLGTKRIGVAVSDELFLTAQGLESIQHRDFNTDLVSINSVVAEYGVGEIVVGLPLNMNGTDSEKTREARTFADDLEKAVKMPVKLWDERLTSVAAERALLEADMSRGRRRQLSDKLAAQFILQGYLDSRKRQASYGKDQTGGEDN